MLLGSLLIGICVIAGLAWLNSILDGAIWASLRAFFRRQ